MIKKYENWLEEEGKREKTIKTYINEIKIFFNWWVSSIGDKEEIIRATSIDLNDYKQFLMTTTNNRGNKYSPATINKKIEVLRSFYTFLEDEEVILNNPMNKVKPQKNQNRLLPPKWLERNERNKLLRVVENLNTWQGNEWRYKRNRAIIYTFLLSGLRLNELVMLNMQDIDFNRGIIHVREGKGGKYRRVELAKDLGSVLNEWLKIRGEVLSSRIFTSQKGGGLTPQGIEHIFRRLRRDTEIADLTPHTLRHTFAKGLVNRGYSLTLIADLLGHTDINTTRLYTKSGEQDRRNALDSIKIIL